VTFLEHFGLVEQPFGVTPDPRFLHLGSKHREALASLVCAGEENRGFVALIGPPGMGKTTLLFQYLEGLRHKARTAFLFQRARNTNDLMRYLLGDLGINTSTRDLPELNAMLNGVLTEEMRAGRHFVLVIDEAQNLGSEVLESVRLLSNFETPWVKLMQIVLAGQPRLAERLARPSMAQLRQRISSFIRLEPFTPEETNAYIDHRLWVAGYAGAGLFTIGARTLIAEHSGGIPRNISNLCYQSLVLAHAVGKEQVKAEMIREVISDLAIESLVPSRGDSTHLRSAMPGRSSETSNSAKPDQIPRLLSSSNSDRRGASRAIVTISASAMLLLSIVSGVLWKANLHTKPLGVTPNVEVAAFPARPTALAPAPETMSPISVGSPAVKTARSGTPSLGGKTAGTALNDHVFTLVVARGTTLRQISLQYLGQFDSADIAAILSLNPTIKDPDHLEAGLEVRLPISLRRDSAINAGNTPAIPPTPATEVVR
jgi:type II secretory pathway predicted ATPase ExeA